MGLTRSEMDAELQALYDQIPAIPDCDGRCWTTCGPIEMSDRERQRIRQAGYRITPYEKALATDGKFTCEALTSKRRCVIWELRPGICRAWGAAEGLKCVYGCVPEGGWIPDTQMYRLLAEASRIGGGEPLRVPSEAEMRQAAARGHLMDQLIAAQAVPAAFRRRSE
jgi:Putative zinc- or iron-chelating domain